MHNFQFYLAHLWTDFQSCFLHPPCVVDGKCEAVPSVEVGRAAVAGETHLLCVVAARSGQHLVIYEYKYSDTQIHKIHQVNIFIPNTRNPKHKRAQCSHSGTKKVKKSHRALWRCRGGEVESLVVSGEEKVSRNSLCQKLPPHLPRLVHLAGHQPTALQLRLSQAPSLQSSSSVS